MYVCSQVLQPVRCVLYVCDTVCMYVVKYSSLCGVYCMYVCSQVLQPVRCVLYVCDTVCMYVVKYSSL